MRVHGAPPLPSLQVRAQAAGGDAPDRRLVHVLSIVLAKADGVGLEAARAAVAQVAAMAARRAGAEGSSRGEGLSREGKALLESAVVGGFALATKEKAATAALSSSSSSNNQQQQQGGSSSSANNNQQGGLPAVDSPLHR